MLNIKLSLQFYDKKKEKKQNSLRNSAFFYTFVSILNYKTFFFIKINPDTPIARAIAAIYQYTWFLFSPVVGVIVNTVLSSAFHSFIEFVLKVDKVSILNDFTFASFL